MPILKNQIYYSSAKLTILLLFLLSAIFYTKESNNEVSDVFILSIVTFLFAAFPIIFCRNYFNPLVIYSALLTLPIFDFILQDLTLSDLRYYTHLARGEENDLRVKALLIINVWIFSLYSSYAIATLLNKKSFEDKKPYSKTNTKSIKIIGVICFILSLGAYLTALNHIGGISSIFESMQNRSESYKGVGYLRNLTQLGLITSICLLALKKRNLSFLCVIFTFIATASFGGRAAAFIGILIPYFFALNYMNKKVSNNTIYLLGILGIIFIVSFEQFKYGDKDLSMDNTKAVSSITRGMADILPSMIYAIETGELDYQFGATTINIFTVIVPRAIWQNKPEGLGEDALLGRALIGEEYWGLPPGPYGVAYLNFGWLGVIFYGFFAGFISAKLFSYYRKNIHSKNSIFILILYPSIFLKMFEFFSVYAGLQIITITLILFFMYKLGDFISKIRPEEVK